MIKADTVIKSKRKTLSVSVDTHGRVIVRAPKHYTDRQINNALAGSQEWILKQLKKYEETKEKTNGLGIADGKSVLLLGEKFVVRFADVKKEIIEGRTITLPKDNPEECLKKLLRRMAKNFFTERAALYSDITGFTPSSVKVTSAKTRWGSCSAEKNICFSLSLIMCPLDVADYVIVHELCHIKYMNHSALFWNEVGKYIPDYKEKRKWLNNNRYIMDLI